MEEQEKDGTRRICSWSPCLRIARRQPLLWRGPRPRQGRPTLPRSVAKRDPLYGIATIIIITVIITAPTHPHRLARTVKTRLTNRSRIKHTTARTTTLPCTTTITLTITAPHLAQHKQNAVIPLPPIFKGNIHQKAAKQVAATRVVVAEREEEEAYEASSSSSFAFPLSLHSPCPRCLPCAGLGRVWTS